MKRIAWVGVAAILMAGSAMAQQVPKQADDQWAPAKSSSARSPDYVPGSKANAADSSAGHFKFKDPRPKTKDAPWPDRTAIDGRAGTNMDSSRPPLNCGQNPSDPKCR
jgi:hypothetical protein